MTDKPILRCEWQSAGRRGLMRTGAIGGAAAFLLAGTGAARARPSRRRR